MPAPTRTAVAAAPALQREANAGAARLPAPGLHRRGPKPAATFRMQFHPGFGFSAARQLIPFLYQLGVSHIYASPIFESRSGSRHGYDIVDPTRLRAELGSEDEFNAFVRDLKRRGMGLILDIVPNHMAACPENPWWCDVLEDGQDSLYADYFDIDWASGAGRLILPWLGGELDQIVARGELQARLEERGLVLRYWEHVFPLRVDAYRCVLDPYGYAPSALRALLDDFENLPAGGRVRVLRKNELKAQLWRSYTGDPLARQCIDAALARLNAGSRSEILRLLDGQHYVLAFWRSSKHRVNYRRFFDIQDLIAVRVEHPEVLTATHTLLFRLAQEGKIDGVRIDHVDGLLDPTGYLTALTDHLAAVAPNRAPYVLVEKILSGEEQLHRAWQVHGATGYEFLDRVNSVFVEADNVERLRALHDRFTGAHSSFDEIAYEQKKRALCELFGGELEKLTTELCALADARGKHAGRIAREHLGPALLEVSACLAVYRTYIRNAVVSAADRRAIERALEAAALRTDRCLHRALAFLHEVLTLDVRNGSLEFQQRSLRFVMRWQQLTAAAMAKGVEDTACYRYNALVSLNEVGGSWRPAGVEAFHQFALRRRASSPFALNASSTHDTKRSEDVRARINVLSEIPDRWQEWLERWSCWNRAQKDIVRGAPAPCPADEIMIYQTLLGAWPLDQNKEAAFRTRFTQFVIKAAREAKCHTSWCEPDRDYEAALVGFVERILAPVEGNQFLDELRNAESLIAPFGAIGSLAQLVLKMTAPGVPDFYQGSLLWDFSLVDPDNRRPVDFERRMRMMDDLCARSGVRGASLADGLRASWRDGRIKLYTAWRTLAYRRSRPDLFLSGDYIPLETTGRAQRHIIAFARRRNGAWAITVVPRLLASLEPRQAPFSCPDIWNGAEIVLPQGAPAGLKNLYTGETLPGPRIRVAAALRRFPVALLSNSGI